MLFKKKFTGRVILGKNFKSINYYIKRQSALNILFRPWINKMFVQLDNISQNIWEYFFIYFFIFPFISKTNSWAIWKTTSSGTLSMLIYYKN